MVLSCLDLFHFTANNTFCLANICYKSSEITIDQVNSHFIEVGPGDVAKLDVLLNHSGTGSDCHHRAQATNIMA